MHDVVSAEHPCVLVWICASVCAMRVQESENDCHSWTQCVSHFTCMCSVPNSFRGCFFFVFFCWLVVFSCMFVAHWFDI